MKAFLVAMMVAGFCCTAEVGEARGEQRISIFSRQFQSELMKACSGCGCRGGGGYRLSNGKCAPRRAAEVMQG